MLDSKTMEMLETWTRFTFMDYLESLGDFSKELLSFEEEADVRRQMVGGTLQQIGGPGNVTYEQQLQHIEEVSDLFEEIVLESARIEKFLPGYNDLIAQRIRHCEELYAQSKDTQLFLILAALHNKRIPVEPELSIRI